MNLYRVLRHNEWISVGSLGMEALRMKRPWKLTEEGFDPDSVAKAVAEFEADAIARKIDEAIELCGEGHAEFVAELKRLKRTWENRTVHIP